MGRFRDLEFCYGGTMKRKCSECLKTFTAIPHNKLTCSQKCAEKRHRRVALERWQAKRPKRKPRACPYCKTDISDTPQATKTCYAEECRRKHRRKNEYKARAITEKRERAKEIRVVPTKPKQNKCKIPGCQNDRGANYLWCPTHHKLKSRMADGR